MYPNTIEVFDSIPLEVVSAAGEEMSELTEKIDALPSEMKSAIIDTMYGNMKIHDDMMDIYDTSGNIIRTFDLKDYTGNPTTTSGVFERIIKDDIDPVTI